MKKHIVFYISSLQKGGTERVFVNLAEYFYSIGCKVTVVTQYCGNNEYAINKGIYRELSDITEAETSGSRIVNFCRRILKLRAVLKRIQPDLVLSCIGKNNFMALISSFFEKTKVVVSVRGEPASEYNSRKMRFLVKTLFAKADGIILQTEDSKKFFPEYLQKKIVVLQNSLNPLFMQERYEGIRDKQIVSMGRLDANKNQVMIIQAFAKIAEQYPEYSVVLYGEGEGRVNLEREIAELKLQNRIQLPGTAADVVAAIRKASVFVLSSNTEGMPNVLIEAMALGLPIISTDCPCGGPKELIRQGKNGILISVGDVVGLAAALTEVLGDVLLADKMGRNAAKIQERLNPEKINRQWQAYFEQIME